MNKKFLSAILFGALMVTSTGTFVSCKDYDDDIENLQGQIDKNSSAIAELQKLVGSGNWVTSISPVAGGFTVTMSNGQSQTITGINGADGKDGKNGTEWTIGEDGFWYMDGEKTENLAVGKNGENGVTAPSPSISANGNWVLYTWDAEKGEFVAEETTIPAQGTAAYVVLKNGAYILHIADENGEYQEVTLPATAESFTISGVANKDVKVVLSYGEWNPSTTKKDKELFDKLAAEFPELKEYKKGDFVEQGGKLPFIVSPANVELTKEHSFALVDMVGKDAGATLSNPTKGMPAGLDLIDGDSDGILESRAQGAAVWSLDFAPALNEKGNGYKDASKYMYSLVVSGPKGVIASTPYVYTYLSEEVKSFSITQDALSMQYAEEIDIFVPTTDGGQFVKTPDHMLKGMFILEVKDAAVAEEYGIEIDGSVITVANMPKGKDTAPITMVLTAIGVNGEVAQDEFDLTIQNKIAATGTLADQDITLKATFNANGTWANNNQTVLWDIKGLGLSALQLKNFVAADSKTFTIVNDDKDAKFTTQTADVVFLNDKKKAIADPVDYTKVAYLAYVLNATNYVPGDYTITLEAIDNSTVIYKAEADMAVANPEESLLTLNADYVDAEGVFNAVGTVSGGKVSYNWYNFFKEVDGYNNFNKMSIVDLDYEYDNTIGAWLTKSESVKGIYLNNADIMTWSADDNAYVGDINQTRNFKVQYKLFNNPNNIGEFEFQVKLISSVYAADPTSVITMTPAKLKIKFDDVTPTDNIAQNAIDFKAITSAIYAQGASKGVTYRLFKSATGETVNGSAATYNFVLSNADRASAIITDAQVNAQFSVSGGYFLGTNGLPVEIAKADLMKFGVTASEYTALTDDDKFYLTVNGFTNDRGTADTADDITVGGLWKMFITWAKYYYADGTAYTDADGNYIASGDTTPLAADADAVAMYNKYVVGKLIAVEDNDDAVDGTPTYYDRADEIYSVVFKCVNAGDTKFFTTSTALGSDCLTGNTLTAKASTTIDKTALVEGKKIIPMQMIITDVWGMKMAYEFNVEISL